MNQVEQQVTIGEACGYKWCRKQTTNSYALRRSCFPNEQIEGDRPPIGTKDVYITCPDYPNDLNAMHEAEMTLKSGFVGKGGQRRDYNEHLWRICLPNTSWDDATSDDFGKYISATAAQRAEAFLKTIGKWVDK